MRVLAAALSALSVSCVAGAPATEGAGARRKLGEDDGLVEVDLSELHKTTTAEEVRRQLTHYDTRVASGECEIRGYNDARCYYQGRWSAPCEDPTSHLYNMRFPLIWCYSVAENGWVQMHDSEEPYRVVVPPDLMPRPDPCDSEQGDAEEPCDAEGGTGSVDPDPLPPPSLSPPPPRPPPPPAPPSLSPPPPPPLPSPVSGGTCTDCHDGQVIGPTGEKCSTLAMTGTGSRRDFLYDVPCKTAAEGGSNSCCSGRGNGCSSCCRRGYMNAECCPCSKFTDTDGDGVMDLTDPDSDADGSPDAEEGTGDSDSDGIPDSLDIDAPPVESDSDSDGKPDTDEREGTGDMDSDGVPNMEDAKDDREWVMKPQPLCNLFTKTVFVGTTAVKQCAAVVLAPGEKCRHFAMSSKQCRGNG